MKYKLFIFDLDGTLADTRKDLANAVNEMRISFGLPILDLAQVISYVGDGAAKLVERSLTGIDVALQEALGIMLKSYKKKICVETCLYPGCREFLELLQSQNYKLAVLTNKPEEMTHEILQALDIHRFFSLIVSPENAGCHKPETGGMALCLQTSEVLAQNALMVGDHHTDLKVAGKLGVDAAFFEGGMGQDGNEDCEYRFTSYEDLKKQLNL